MNGEDSSSLVSNMGEMQEILVDVTVLSLFVLLFFIVSRKRHDDRLRCWMAGWVSVVLHFVATLWQPLTPAWQKVQSCASADALAVAALFFVVSTMVQSEGRRQALRLFFLLGLGTLLCLNAAIVGDRDVWGLLALVVIRQGMAIVLAWRPRLGRSGLEMIIGGICALTGVWMVSGIVNGRPEVVVAALLSEMYLVVAIDFWANGWPRTLAMKIVTAGMAGWGAVFAVSYELYRIWPHAQIDREVWNVPEFLVAVGMILLVIEEDTSAARAMAEDYRVLFEGSPEPLWIVEVATLRFLAVNQAALDLHGYTREEFLKLKLTDVLPAERHGPAIAALQSPVLNSQHRSVRHLRKDGREITLDLTACDKVFQGTRCRFVLAVNASEREELQQRLDHRAGHDVLTGLPNRILLPELLGKAVSKIADSSEKIAILSLDIDRFKRVNDLFGLRIGDRCLERAADLLTSRLRSMDIIARTEGDEFTIVLTGLKSVGSAERVVRDLLRAFEEPLLVEGYRIQLTVSIGVTVGPDEEMDALALWRAAESARADAEAAGGNRAVWFSAELRKAAEEQAELETYLRLHMNDGGLHLVYQPIYSADGAIQSLEALLRLDHPVFGPVSPGKMIQIAESSGLIVPLGEWVIEEACRQQLMWKARGVTLVPVAVNVSALQIMHVDFARRLMATLERYALEPRLMHVELTESAAMRNVTEVTEQIAALAAYGIEFSIDDFGTGHSSLARLTELGASILKIDRSFMQPDCTRHGHTIVQAIITMAHTLGYKVVAEGVETEKQLACLLGLDCDLLQGYLLSRPVIADQIPALLAVRPRIFDSLPAQGEVLRLVTRAHA